MWGQSVGPLWVHVNFDVMFCGAQADLWSALRACDSFGTLLSLLDVNQRICTQLVGHAGFDVIACGGVIVCGKSVGLIVILV